MRRFYGHKDPERRADAERGGRSVDETYFTPFYKKAPVYAVQVNEEFSVDTLEGVHTGKAGDWLAIGTSGEMYPIDAEVMAESYGREPSVEDRLQSIIADLDKATKDDRNPQLGVAARHVEEALELVRVWALGIAL